VSTYSDGTGSVRSPAYSTYSEGTGSVLKHWHIKLRWGNHQKERKKGRKEGRKKEKIKDVDSITY
jgi:hypothetical protein